ncbi:hypothetical protein GCM10020254_46020 [Streptomyces goshikiensis]
MKCRLAAGELKDVNAGIPALLPVAVIGWFAAGYTAKAAGVVAGGAVAAGGAGAAAAASGGSTAGAGAAGASGAGGSGAGGAVASEGLGLPVKAALAAGIAITAAAGVVFALAGDDPDAPVRERPAPAVAAPVVPAPEASAPPAPKARPSAAKTPAARESVRPSPSTPPPSPTPTPSPSRSRPAPAAPVPSPSKAKPSPAPTPTPTPSAERPAPARGFPLARLRQSALGDHSGPEVQTWQSGWVWQRGGLEIGGRRYGQGITVNSLSSVEIALNRQCTAFSARAGVDGLSRFTDGSVRFSVYADGQRLWQSGALGYEDPAAAVDVPLTGRGTLRLVVERAGGRRPAGAGELGRRRDQLPLTRRTTSAGVSSAPAASASV